MAAARRPGEDPEDPVNETTPLVARRDNLVLSTKEGSESWTPDGPTTASEGPHLVTTSQRIRYVDPQKGVNKIVTFDPCCFLGWAALVAFSGTVFELGMVRFMLLSQMALGCIVCLIAMRMPSLASNEFNTQELDLLIKFLMTFLAFMTGIFVNGAFTQWQGIMNHVFTLEQCVKNLYMDLAVLGAPREALNDFRRWGLCSLWLTAIEAPASWEPPDWQEAFDDFKKHGMLNDEECTVLRSRVDTQRAPLMWVWAMTKLRDLSDKGTIPAKATPSFTALLGQCHTAQTSINSIIQSIMLQVPYQYMHMLAFLIQLFNVLNTVRCGIDLASDILKLRQNPAMTPTAMQVQNLLVHFSIMMLGPLIYQAFLTVSLDISIPFGDGSTDIPIRFLLHRFAQELADMDSFLFPSQAGPKRVGFSDKDAFRDGPRPPAAALLGRTMRQPASQRSCEVS